MRQRFTSDFIDPSFAIAARTDCRGEDVLATVAQRFIGENPPTPFTFRAFDTRAFSCLGDGLWDLDLSSLLPDARPEQVALICTRFYKVEDCIHKMRVSCYGPTEIFVNGQTLFCSDVSEEVNIKVERILNMHCIAGENTVIIRVKKVASGFGCRFGAFEAQGKWLSFLAPFSERRGYGGLVYTQAMDDTPALAHPSFDAAQSESATGYVWYPRPQDDAVDSPTGVFQQLFGKDEGAYALALSSVELAHEQQVTLRIDDAGGEITVYLGGRCYHGNALAAQQGVRVSLPRGTHKVLVASRCTLGQRWGFALSIENSQGKAATFVPAYPVQGASDPWLYLGPLQELAPDPMRDMTSLLKLYGGDKKCYWCLNIPGVTVRPYLESTCFGRWNYPLGVTLYGMIRTARVLGRKDIADYVHRHIDLCVSMDEYSLWDREQYGFPEINTQLSDIQMLDDCGSFGCAMLEASDGVLNDAQMRIARRIAHHMRDKQERREDGAFYRRLEGYFMEDTLWVDDLYMSTPYLRRYARLTGEASYMEDAVRQFLLYRSYLLIEEQGVMSHVYDFKYRTATKMPWGRGNGWCLFSLAELLCALERSHKKWQELRTFFNVLCRGILPLQSQSGLWRQLLTDEEAYEESSCTAMFVYALCLALSHDLLDAEQIQPAEMAAMNGWRGLCGKAIDVKGNVYGICAGSCYAFTKTYYKQKLGWIENDPHGIGVVLLAGIEYMRYFGS